MVEFIQWLRPRGERRDIIIEASKRTEELALILKASGGVFEVEVLRTGQVSLTISVKKDKDFIEWAHEIVPNDTQIPYAVDKLVECAWNVYQVKTENNKK